MERADSKASPWLRMRRAAAWPLALLLAAIIVFEEYAWDELAAALARLGRWPPFAALERWVARRSPHAALALFLAPALTLLPVKLAALFLIEQGHALLGLAVILLAKLGGTALVAWLFALTRPVLMSVPWFVRWYRRFERLRAWVFERLRTSLPWRWRGWRKCGCADSGPGHRRWPAWRGGWQAAGAAMSPRRERIRRLNNDSGDECGRERGRCQCRGGQDRARRSGRSCLPRHGAHGDRRGGRGARAGARRLRGHGRRGARAQGGRR
ncbi:Uncharacterised protein [Chromobacterium violaceum]|uniref:Uncharacterized protein n=1 Tax=Chromobacterium violaceum TaxID=536 RepID=A0A447TDB6_CHRVL|nr:Uncharacterised protein [Chromobacterium violaceum]